MQYEKSTRTDATNPTGAKMHGYAFRNEDGTKAGFFLDVIADVYVNPAIIAEALEKAEGYARAIAAAVGPFPALPGEGEKFPDLAPGVRIGSSYNGGRPDIVEVYFTILGAKEDADYKAWFIEEEANPDGSEYVPPSGEVSLFVGYANGEDAPIRPLLAPFYGYAIAAAEEATRREG